MGRSEEFQAGAVRHIDLFHGTSPEAAEAIKEGGLHPSYEDSAHLTTHPQTARGYGGAVIHFRVPRQAVEEHGEVGNTDERYYGIRGHLDPSYIHCVGGDCTKDRPLKQRPERHSWSMSHEQEEKHLKDWNGQKVFNPDAPSYWSGHCTHSQCDFSAKGEHEEVKAELEAHVQKTTRNK